MSMSCPLRDPFQWLCIYIYIIPCWVAKLIDNISACCINKLLFMFWSVMGCFCSYCCCCRFLHPALNLLHHRIFISKRRLWALNISAIRNHCLLGSTQFCVVHTFEKWRLGSTTNSGTVMWSDGLRPTAIVGGTKLLLLPGQGPMEAKKFTRLKFPISFKVWKW